MPKMYGFDESGVERIVEAVRYVEKSSPPRTGARPGLRSVHMPNIQVVRVTSDTATDGRYPGKLQVYDASAKTYSDGPDCWVVDVNEGALEETNYVGRLSGLAGSPEYPVFVVTKQEAGGGGSAVFSGVKVYKSTDQTTSSGTEFDLTWNAEDFDLNNYHSNFSNTDRLTAPSTGYYHVGVCITWGSSSVGDRYLCIRMNGVTDTAIRQVADVTDGLAIEQSCSTLLLMGAGDYVTFHVHQNSGGNLDVQGYESAGIPSTAWMYKVGDYVSE